MRNGFVIRLFVALTAAAALWAFLVNRFVLRCADTAWKEALIVLLGPALAGVAVALVRAEKGRAKWVPAVILALFAVGEVRLAILRHGYGVGIQTMTVADLLDPDTTTDLTVRRHTIDMAGLGGARVRVVHMTDLHITEALPEAYFQRVKDAIAALAPDLLFITGDYLCRAERFGLLEHWLETLPHGRLGTFATLGNHDYWLDAGSIRVALERAGVRVLGGRCETIDVGEGAHLRVCGTDEPWGPGFAFAPSSADGERDTPTVALTHTPDNVYALDALGVDAVFAGHTHGGQLRLPLLGPVIVPSRYGRRFDRGHFLVGRTHLFVSAGVGADDPALRLWCPPELLAVDLVGSAAR